MTAAMDIRQTAHYMAVAICTLIVQAFLCLRLLPSRLGIAKAWLCLCARCFVSWLIGILWNVIREIVNGVFRVVISVIVLILSLITFFGLLLWLLTL